MKQDIIIAVEHAVSDSNQRKSQDREGMRLLQKFCINNCHYIN